jgi:[ribosomal protein S18]-alanine N-acetyltransferase
VNGGSAVRAGEHEDRFSIEPMRRRHLASVIRIEHHAHPRPWSLGVFAGELAQGDGRYYVVGKLDGKVAGYAGMMFVADEAHVTNIAVAPAARRRGVATRLLAHLVAVAVSRRCRAMTLEVRMGNTAAQDLYRKFGFQDAGVRPNYYPETGEDGLVMWLYEIGSAAVRARVSGLEAGA